jgi:hypothetical protein
MYDFNADKDTNKEILIHNLSIYLSIYVSIYLSVCLHASSGIRTHDPSVWAGEDRAASKIGVIHSTIFKKYLRLINSRLHSSGIWRHVVRELGANVLEEPAASIFGAEDGGSRSFRNVCTKLHGIMLQKTVIVMLTIVVASNLT